MPTNVFYSHGKLLLTAEYLVLDGATALGLPTKLGQELLVSTSSKHQSIRWKSLLHNQETWLDCLIQWNANLEFFCEDSSDEVKKLLSIFGFIAKLKPNLFSSEKGYSFTSTLQFPKNWGLGSSSTLINNLAQWANIDAFALQNFAFGGSGYDIACAQQDSPILFKKTNAHNEITPAVFNPVFKEELFFVYLNQKQNSRDAIQHYRNQSPENVQLAIARVDEITQQLLKVSKIEDFEALLRSHEKIIASMLGQFPIQKRVFSDFNRSIKSLGAWGGDFILATGGISEKNYFTQKGYTTIVDFEDMML